MALRVQSVKGARDLVPPEVEVWARVESIARRVFALHGFGEIRTPVFEETELFARTVGTATDIVGKEMYSFTDKGGRHLTLRPESTAPVCRAYIEHGMHSLPQPVRLFYIGPHFRYERPQRGRHRQFHQIGVEILGGQPGESDVEALAVLLRFLRELGFADTKVLVNTVGDAASRQAFRERLVDYLRPHAERLSEDSQRRLESNPLRILDTKSREERELLAAGPRLEDSLTAASRERFAFVRSRLQEMGVSHEIEPRLVRGLDYYTNVVFEIVSEGLGAQDAICGGGAYEGLVEELGGPPTYGVGFAIGEDRLVEALPESSAARARPPGPVVIRAIARGRGAVPGALDVDAAELAEQLRNADIAAISLGAADPKKAHAAADALHSPMIVIVGSEELHAGTLTLRDTKVRREETLPRAEAMSRLKELYGR